MDVDIPENQSASERAASGYQEGGQVGQEMEIPSSKAWQQEIAAAQQFRETFNTQGDRTVNRYLDKRENDSEKLSKYNLFTVNTQILLSTLYAKFPQPLVTREWEDSDDDVARTAAIILERNLRIRKRDMIDASIRLAVIDRLVPGMGAVWFRYEPTIQSAPMPPETDPATGQPMPPPVDPATGQPMPPQMMDKIVWEDVPCDYVHWKDFLWSPCRVWDECRWVARRVKMTREDVEKRFGEQIASAIAFNAGSGSGRDDKSNESSHYIVKYACIYEIWCKRTRKIYWVTEGYERCLDVKADPFGMPNFWPTPKPLFALTATNSTVPRNDYLMIQDQYEALDRINNRIAYLERAVKVAGVYDKTNKEIARLLNEDVDNQLIGADNFSRFQERGGMRGMIDWLPIDQIVAAIEKLRVYRQDLVAQIYELSGISDIMRGASKASETLGAQELKAQYGGVRLQHMQMQVAEFVEEALEIKAWILQKMYTPETLKARSNIMMTPDAALADQAIQLMKTALGTLRVEVHADSMAVPEFNAERDARLQYLRTTAEFLTAMAPAIQQSPGSAPYFLKMLQWGAAGFRVGRTIEGILDQAVAAAEKALANPPPPPPPDPEKLSKAKNQVAQSILNTAKAVGQTIENEAMKKNPDAILPHPPEPPESSTTN